MSDDLLPWKKTFQHIQAVHSIVADIGFVAPELYDFTKQRIANHLREIAKVLDIELETPMTEEKKAKDTYEIKITFTRDLEEDIGALEDQKRAARPRDITWKYAAQLQLIDELNKAKDKGFLNGEFKVDSCDLLYKEELEADGEFVKQFPECVKWSEVADEGRSLREFLEYLNEEGALNFDGPMQELIYRYFEIDEEALEENRNRLYEALRKNPWPVVVETKEG